MLFHCLSNLPPRGYIIVPFSNKNQPAVGMVANIVHSFISLSFNKKSRTLRTEAFLFGS